MSDEKLRELERKWKESGSTEDEAAYLLERVRVGDLTQERLRLAADLGYLAALAADKRPARATSPGGPELTRLALTLQRYGREAVVRSAIGIGQCLIEQLRSEPRQGERAQALQALEAWLSEPTARRAVQAREAARAATPDMDESVGLQPAYFAATAFTLLGGCASTKRPAQHLAKALQRAMTVHPLTGEPAVSPNDLVQALSEALVPWVLAT